VLLYPASLRPAHPDLLPFVVPQIGFQTLPNLLVGTRYLRAFKVTNRLTSGSFISEGSFSDDSDEGFFGEDRLGGEHGKKWNVPEGGAEVTYLLLSGIAVLAGILISGKQRRATHAARSF
jgi:hypothetical protein